MKIKINRQLAGVEDIAWGTGTVTQLRGGELVEITEINAGNLPFDESLTLQQVLDERYPQIQAVGENIDIVTVVGDNIINVNLIGSNIEDVLTVAREIVSIVSVHLSLPDITLTAQHAGHIEIICNDLVEQGVMYIHDLGSITEPVEYPEKGKSDIITVSNSIEHVDSVSNHIVQVEHVSNHMPSVNIVGEDLMMVGLGKTLDAGLVIDPVENTPAGISLVETVATNIDSVIIDAENIEDIKKVADNIGNVNATGENIHSIDIIGRDLTLAGFAYMMDCGSVDDPIVEVPQTVSNIITVADNMDKIDAVADHISGVVAIADDLATGQIGSAIDGGLITDPVDLTPAGESNIEKVADNIADVAICGQNIQTIIDGYKAALLAIAAEAMAQKWAEEDFNVEVIPGAYSAKHWATVASTIVGAGIIDDSIISLATTYSSDKIEAVLTLATTDMVQISSPVEGALAMYVAGAWAAVTELDMGTL